MNIEQLLLNDYKEFKTNPIISTADRCFQKRVIDDYGKKYYITVYYYNSFIDGHTRESYEIDLQFNKTVNDIGFTHNIKIFGFGKYDEEEKVLKYDEINIKDIEDHVEDIWLKNDFDYYEFWN